MPFPPGARTTKNQVRRYTKANIMKLIIITNVWDTGNELLQPLTDGTKSTNESINFRKSNELR